MLLTWKVRKRPFTDPDDYELVTGSRGAVQQRNAPRTHEGRKKAAAATTRSGGRLLRGTDSALFFFLRALGRVGLADRVYGLPPLTTVSQR
jgi:hypothetical protein